MKPAVKRHKKGRPLREWVPGELRRGYDQRYDWVLGDMETLRQEAHRASLMFAAAMKQPATRGARSWP